MRREGVVLHGVGLQEYLDHAVVLELFNDHLDCTAAKQF